MNYAIIIDMEAFKQLKARYGQYLLYKKNVTPILINKTKTITINMQLIIGSISSIRLFLLDISIGSIGFHVVEIDKSFLIWFENMDKLNVHFNNLKNILIISTKSVPGICHFGQSFLFQNKSLLSLIANCFNNNPCFLTNIELRQLHCRFGYFSAKKLQKVLECARYEIDKQIIDNLTRYSTNYQKH